MTHGRTAGAVLSVTLLVAYVGCARRTTWDLSYDRSLAADAKSVSGKACQKDEDCGPFICESGVQRCLARSCRMHAECWPNACIQNLCTRAPRQSGSSCEPLDSRELEHLDENEELARYEALDGCACEPQGSFDESWARGSPCGQFPCTPAGCYVSQCFGDDNCRFGLCSSHASGPHGYCVTSDPH